jgi:hypothetical protein
MILENAIKRQYYEFAIDTKKLNRIITFNYDINWELIPARNHETKHTMSCTMH